MIVRAPGLVPGIDDRPAMFLDLPPTILALLGLPPHPSFQGISLAGDGPDPNRPLFMIAQTPAAYETAMVESGFKLHFVEEEGLWVLNDLARDPGETVDIAASRTDLVERLRRRLLQWRREQLAYYGDVERQRREYPPFFRP
jgi:arylsulfatase A-like enzyme